MPESPKTSSIPSPGHGTFRLSEDLAKLQEKAREQSLSLGDVIFLLDDRARTFLLLLLSLPFVQPIPLPGLSTPFGVAIALLGIGSLVGQKPWLPDRFLKMQLPDMFLAPALRVMRRLARIMEVLLRPRILFLATNPTMQRLEGLCILVCGVLLCLPLPIPFSNMLPATTVITFACSTLGKDGFFYVGGILCFAITVLFFVAIGFGGTATVAWVYEWLAQNMFAE
jgi:hypothetical protein